MILLDTCIVVPLLRDEADTLPGDIATMLAETAPPFPVSVISLWEMAIKHRKGKLPVATKIEQWPELCTLLGMSLLPVETAHAIHAIEPQPQTNDPFDRMLLSICSLENLRLVTTDRALLDHPLAWRA